MQFPTLHVSVSKACGDWIDEAKLKSNRSRRTLGFDAISNSASSQMVRLVAIGLCAFNYQRNL
jgi:hypothetical protein